MWLKSDGWSINGNVIAMITCEKVNNATSTPLIMTPADIRWTTAEKTGEMRGEEKGRNLFGNPDYPGGVV